jgi:hypothetical protein
MENEFIIGTAIIAAIILVGIILRNKWKRQSKDD